MKHTKKFLVLALIIISAVTVATTAFAAYRPWQNRWNAHAIFPNTFPPSSNELYQQIKNLQSDLNVLRSRLAVFSSSSSTYYFAELTVDGQYGPNSANAIRKVQSYYSLTVDGICGVDTKNKLWNALGYQPPAT